MLRSYLPVLVFGGLGLMVGTALVLVNGFLGPKRPNAVKSEAYESGIPAEISRTFRFGISFYMVAMMFILFDIEVIFLVPVSTILLETSSVYALGAVLLFIFFLAVAFVYEWAKGGLDWK